MNDTDFQQPTRAQLPEPTLRRLPWYLAYVSTLAKEGVDHVSSTAISRAVGVDSSQIAKDLSFINIKGKTRIGYQVTLLEQTLRDFLGFDEVHNAAIVGVGSLGSALIGDRGLQRFGLSFVAGFDVNPAIVGTAINGVNVYHIDDMPQICKRMHINVAALTVPVETAQRVADRIMDAGVPAIWNFTPSRICVRPDCVVQNTSIYSHLAVMYNRMLTARHQQ